MYDHMMLLILYFRNFIEAPPSSFLLKQIYVLGHFCRSEETAFSLIFASNTFLLIMTKRTSRFFLHFQIMGFVLSIEV